ncbi:hypothetical protein EVAR_3296_1 [Eumeta japonica]|uniref:Uncharacterized protein n=1 Tax=Eumeta variegata TaxID=151549 RepID=A0A4C1SV56_EUMVA|nr:hypothetical protein EVAR_3296_1 [Eumeta japonica]
MIGGRISIETETRIITDKGNRTRIESGTRTQIEKGIEVENECGAGIKIESETAAHPQERAEQRLPGQCKILSERYQENRLGNAHIQIDIMTTLACGYRDTAFLKM